MTLDPALSSDVNTDFALSMVFTGLVQLDDNLHVQPQLAQSWDRSSEGLDWTFHLRPDLKFSDGTPLTSKDVAYSIDRALQPATKSTTCLSYLGLIKGANELHTGMIKTIIGNGVITPDNNTVILRLREKAAYFLDALTYSCSYVVEKKLIDKYKADFTQHLNEGGSSGPFEVAQIKQDQEVDFVPNPNYYGPKPLLREVIFAFYPDQSFSYQDYQSGSLDYTDVPLARLNDARKLTQEFHLVPQLTINSYAMNFRVKPFDVLPIRQAFALAINREAINHSVWKDSQIPTIHIVPQGMVGFNPSLTGPAGVKDDTGDPTLARQLLQQGLKEEGWSSMSQMPPIKLIPNNIDEANALIKAWKDVLGVTVTLDTTATGPTDNSQIWATSWAADYPDPQDWLTLQFDNGSPNNVMHYGQNNSSNASEEQLVQQQLESADTESDPATRILSYQEAEQALVNDVAWMPMFQATTGFLVKPYVQGLTFNLSEPMISPNDWANIYIGMNSLPQDTTSGYLEKPSNLNFAEGLSGWSMTGANTTGYSIGVDRSTKLNGEASLLLQSVVPQPIGFGALGQFSKSNIYRGKRVRMSGFVKATGVEQNAELWMRVDGERNRVLDFASTTPIQGTQDWAKYEMVLDVPTDSVAIAFGMVLNGKGQAWLNHVQFEVVDSNVPTTENSGTELLNIKGTKKHTKNLSQ